LVLFLAPLISPGLPLPAHILSMLFPNLGSLLRGMSLTGTTRLAFLGALGHMLRTLLTPFEGMIHSFTIQL
jgi:hypothetical protein